MDRRARGGKGLGDVAADAGRRTGDDGHLALHAELVQDVHRPAARWR
jgi:hypothetical protein